MSIVLLSFFPWKGQRGSLLGRNGACQVTSQAWDVWSWLETTDDPVFFPAPRQQLLQSLFNGHLEPG